MTATNVMIDGIKESCGCWGRAMRWVLSSTHEGYPSMASFERANQGDMDIKSPILRQRFGEVLTKDALEISRAIRTAPFLPEELHRVLFMHYVVPRFDNDGAELSTARKAKELGYQKRQYYYAALDNAHHFLLARIAIPHINHDTVIPRS